MNELTKKERICEICQEIFIVKYPSSKVKTCLNVECRKTIYSLGTTRYFKNNIDAKKNSSDKLKLKWKDPEYREKTMLGIKEIRNFKKENHPSWGKIRSDEQKKHISDGIQKNKDDENIDKIVEKINNNYEFFKDQLFEKKEKICNYNPNWFKKKKLKLEELKIKKGNICVDCGCNDCLEFDHLGDKVNTIFNMKLNEMEKEAEKCELRCRMCHAIKSHNENYKINDTNKRRIDTEKNIANRLIREKRRKYINNIKKEIGGCQYCKYINDDMPCLFDFDHIDPSIKNKGISWLVGHGSSVKIIHKELEKCILLCKKCHFKRTVIQMDYASRRCN